MRFLLPLLVILTFWTTQVSAQSLAETFYDSTAILYSQSKAGNMMMRCTATVFERDDDEYLFVTASHCVADDDTEEGRVKLKDTSFYISFDGPGVKVFYPADVVMAGYQNRGDDVAVLRVKSNDEWPLVRMGQYPEIKVGAEIINVAAPMGLGKQVFSGYVSMVDLDRPFIEDKLNWTHTMLVQVPMGPGSSGSCVVSKEQGAVVALLVGRIPGNPSTVAVPVSRFLEFRIMVESGQYKWFELSE